MGYSTLIAYASQSLSGQEDNYGITELETLAVMWTITFLYTTIYNSQYNVTALDHQSLSHESDV